MDTTPSLTLPQDQEKALKDAGFTKTGSSQYSKGDITISWVDCPLFNGLYFSVHDQGSLFATSYYIDTVIRAANIRISLNQVAEPA